MTYSGPDLVTAAAFLDQDTELAGWFQAGAVSLDLAEAKQKLTTADAGAFVVCDAPVNPECFALEYKTSLGAVTTAFIEATPPGTACRLRGTHSQAEEFQSIWELITFYATTVCDTLDVKLNMSWMDGHGDLDAPDTSAPVPLQSGTTTPMTGPSRPITPAATQPDSMHGGDNNNADTSNFDHDHDDMRAIKDTESDDASAWHATRPDGLPVDMETARRLEDIARERETHLAAILAARQRVRDATKTKMANVQARDLEEKRLRRVVGQCREATDAYTQHCAAIDQAKVALTKMKRQQIENKRHLAKVKAKREIALQAEDRAKKQLALSQVHHTRALEDIASESDQPTSPNQRRAYLTATLDAQMALLRLIMSQRVDAHVEGAEEMNERATTAIEGAKALSRDHDNVNQNGQDGQDGNVDERSQDALSSFFRQALHHHHEEKHLLEQHIAAINKERHASQARQQELQDKLEAIRSPDGNSRPRPKALATHESSSVTRPLHQTLSTVSSTQERTSAAPTHTSDSRAVKPHVPPQNNRSVKARPQSTHTGHASTTTPTVASTSNVTASVEDAVDFDDL
eukprot:m.205390 g.205390  ORF g.205390 m.205390 type:complete len:575 (+) comp22911_c0_seq1:3-1727(+)